MPNMVNWTKIDEKRQNSKLEMRDIFGDFQTLCSNVLCVTRLPLPYFFLMIDLWV